MLDQNEVDKLALEYEYIAADLHHAACLLRRSPDEVPTIFELLELKKIRARLDAALKTLAREAAD